MDIDFCPNCGVGLRDELIFDAGMRKKGNRKDALAFAECYGATETEGWFKREIAVYDRAKDRTVAWRCPACACEWKPASWS